MGAAVGVGMAGFGVAAGRCAKAARIAEMSGVCAMILVAVVLKNMVEVKADEAGRKVL